MFKRVIFDLPKSQIKKEQKDILDHLCRKTDCKNILEIGSWLGESTEVLARNAIKNNGRVYCVDWWQGNPGTWIGNIAKKKDVFNIFKRNIDLLGIKDVVVPIVGKSSEVYDLFKDDYFDLVFIDADHRYLPIKEDIKNYISKVKFGGIICGHDCEGSIYDERFIHQDTKDSVHHGVCKAVFEELEDVNIDREIWWKVL